MSAGGGTEEYDVGSCLFHTLSIVRKNRRVGNPEVRDRLAHAFGLLVADSDNLGVGVVEYHTQVVAHVQVFEVDSGDLPGHVIRPCMVEWKTELDSES